MKIFRNSVISIFIFVFLFFFFFLIINFHIIPNKFEVSPILFLGFGIIIIGIFYFFLNFNSPNNVITKFKIPDENTFKIIIITLMTITIFIPPVVFSDMIIAWSELPPLNYIRAAVFIIGSLFIPGSCIFNLILPQNTLNTIKEKFNIQPFMVKITIYPLISLTFLGIFTLMLNFFQFNSTSITYILLFSIFFLFFFDVFLQKKTKKKIKMKTTEIKISKFSFIIIIIGLGITFISLAIYLAHPYIVAGDRWRGISSASLIGTRDFEIFNIYVKYWGCISFSLGVLLGIPYINANVFLLPFMYLSITSIYLLMKVLLKNLDERYSILSCIFITLLFRPEVLILQFGYRTYSYLSFFMSLTLFFIILKSDLIQTLKNRKNIKLRILGLSSLFLLQAFICYFISALVGFITILLFTFFSGNLKHNAKKLLIFLGFFIILLFLIDLMAYNFFSFWCMQFLTYFTGIPFNFHNIEIWHLRMILSSILFYALLLFSFISLFLIYKFSSPFLSIINKAKLKIERILEEKSKLILGFFYFFITISLLFIIIIANFQLDSLLIISFKGTENLLLIFYLIPSLIEVFGFLGILMLYLSYFCFKENRKLFFLLIVWLIILIILSSFILFLIWIQYPTSFVFEISQINMSNIYYWFSRIWYFSVIPLSILGSIGLIRFIQDVQEKGWFKIKSRGRLRLKNYKELITYLHLVSLLIILLIPSLTVKFIRYDNYYRTSNEDAQIIGWVSENIPRNSKILTTSTHWWTAQRLRADLYISEIYLLSHEMRNVNNNISKLKDSLLSQNINYLILPKELRSEYTELLDTFYCEKLYEYENSIIYTTE